MINKRRFEMIRRPWAITCLVLCISWIWLIVAITPSKPRWSFQTDGLYLFRTFSSDSRYLMSCSASVDADGRSIVPKCSRFDVWNGQSESIKLEVPTSSIEHAKRQWFAINSSEALLCSPDGEHFSFVDSAKGGNRHEIQLRKFKAETTIWKAIVSKVHSLQFSPDGCRFAAFYDSMEKPGLRLSVVDCDTSEVRQLPLAGSSTSRLLFSMNGRFIGLTSSEFNSNGDNVQIWDLNATSSKPIRVLGGELFALSGTGRFAAVKTNQREVLIHEVASGRALFSLAAPNAGDYDEARFSDAEDKLAVFLIDLRSQVLREVSIFSLPAPITTTGSHMPVALSNPQIHRVNGFAWDFHNGKSSRGEFNHAFDDSVVNVWTGDIVGKGANGSISATPDGHVVLSQQSGSRDDDWKRLKSFLRKFSIALAARLEDRTPVLRFFDVRRDRQILAVRGAIQGWLSPDGRTIATFNPDYRPDREGFSWSTNNPATIDIWDTSPKNDWSFLLFWSASPIVILAIIRIIYRRLFPQRMIKRFKTQDAL